MYNYCNLCVSFLFFSHHSTPQIAEISDKKWCFLAFFFVSSLSTLSLHFAGKPPSSTLLLLFNIFLSFFYTFPLFVSLLLQCFFLIHNIFFPFSLSFVSLHLFFFSSHPIPFHTKNTHGDQSSFSFFTIFSYFFVLSYGI